MMIEIENIHKTFNHRNVLKGVSLQVEKGEILAVIGGSGVGKSVLLKHIAALMHPDRGSIVVNNLEVARLKGRALEEYRDHLGYLFQGGALFDSMNVYDNIA
ncbi:MAG: ATP-binding cassette domain-containing protein, partial [Deltaproteobacteria bacterium]|nr:ATP-binding cassette domain-containing protein [Deltaproteobacteria bacterium]